MDEIFHKCINMVSESKNVKIFSKNAQKKERKTPLIPGI